MPQPACELMHIVTRSGYRISTDSTSVPSKSFHSVLRVSSSSHETCRTTDISSGSSASVSLLRLAAGMSVQLSGSFDIRPK